MVLAVDHDVDHRCGDACTHAVFTHHVVDRGVVTVVAHVTWQHARTVVRVCHQTVVARHHVGATIDDGWDEYCINHVNDAVGGVNVGHCHRG